MEIVPKKRATPSEGGWLARRGCHLDENSRVMGELVPKPLTPSSSPVSSSSSSLSDVRSGDQDQGLGSRITRTLFHCFFVLLYVSQIWLHFSSCSCPCAPVVLTSQALECFKPLVFEGTIKQVGIVSTRMPNLGPSCLVRTTAQLVERLV